ncbi:hypothetical protein JQ608_20380 [Bradyrhizobium liaoningense]|nr:hypothetical protein [Bradyrhizobium liaoningense]MBR0879495.1 hypothetical protein [Bradyrhizobium liaoningense]
MIAMSVIAFSISPSRRRRSPTKAALLKMAQTIGGLVASVDTLTRQWRLC